MGRKKVERLMKAAGLRGISKRSHATTTVRDKRQRLSADLVDRKFYADEPNVQWVAGITYGPIWADFFYHAIVLNSVSRPIVSWEIA